MAESDDTATPPGKGRTSSLNLDHLTVAELTEVIRRAEALRQEKQEGAKAALLAKWQAEAAENNLSLDTILAGQQPAAGAGPQGAARDWWTRWLLSSAIPKPGKTWSGRGREPIWIKGKNREEFKIQ